MIVRGLTIVKNKNLLSGEVQFVGTDWRYQKINLGRSYFLENIALSYICLSDQHDCSHFSQF